MEKIKTVCTGTITLTFGDAVALIARKAERVLRHYDGRICGDRPEYNAGRRADRPAEGR